MSEIETEINYILLSKGCPLLKTSKWVGAFKPMCKKWEQVKRLVYRKFGISIWISKIDINRYI
jgi:hypothetical protein